MKTEAELLKSFIQSNKEVREKKALKLGYKNAQDYIDYLKSKINSNISPVNKPQPKKKKVLKNTNVPIVHIVDILDVSGSMTGEKLKAATIGINSSIEDLKKEKDINYLYTYCEFCSSSDIKIPHLGVKISDVNGLLTSARGYTALYDAIGRTFNALEKVVEKEHKVLVNIYTDGQENDSREFNAFQIYKKIESLEKNGYTITFIGTRSDVEFVKTKLKIDDSNTLIHDNTAKGIEMAFSVNSTSRTAYGKKLKAGLDVSKGFYKNIKK